MNFRPNPTTASFLIFIGLQLVLISGNYAQDNTQLLKRWAFSEEEITATRLNPALLHGIQFFHFSYLSDGKKVNGYFATPEGEGPKPCILWNDGGVAKYFPFPSELAPKKFLWLLKAGYAVIACNYKDEANSEAKDEFGGQDVDHVLNLLEILAEFPEIDTTSLGMFGWSRGGMESYMVHTRTDKIRATVVGGAPSDLFLNAEHRPEMELHVFADVMPDYKISRHAALNRRSAIKWADQFPRDVPILILHGTSDWRVRPEQSIRLALELDKYRVPYRLILYEGGDHGISEHKEESNGEAIKWFDRFVKNKEALPNMAFHGN